MNYIIDFDKLTIQNAESNGVKAIHCITNHAGGVPHLSYENDDRHLWWQMITLAEFVALELAMVEPTPTAEDYSMGVQI